MKKAFKVLSVLISVAFLLVGCGGGGGGGTSGGGGGATTTSVSGKVSLSGTAKAAIYSATVASKVRASKSTKPLDTGLPMQKVLSTGGVSAAQGLVSAVVELYDADKPEWLYPIGVALTDADGNYTLDKLTNSALNVNTDGSAPYSNNAAIPAGNYTIIASKYDTGTLKLLVAVQAIVKKFEGTVAGNDLTAQDSDAIPSVTSMLGLAKNSDGTYGSSTTPLPQNAAIQITFSMAMGRISVIDASSIKDSAGANVPGKWKVSPDLLAVTFYPFSALSPNTVYTVAIGGGKSQKTAKNMYGKPIAANVTGYFKAIFPDSTPPTAIRNRPTNLEKTVMPITTPIRIAADETLDINTISIASTPSIGDKPSIKFVGKSDAIADSSYPFVYEIVPSSALKLSQTYSLTVSGGKDMAGNVMDTLNFSFTTEATSAGVTGTGGTATGDAQLGVKDVLGKWISAMNARNSSLLTSYMSGDFYWLNDTASYGMSSDDKNRDGRLSLNEFTGMLNTWFQQLDHCGSTVTGDVVGTISVTGSTANIVFTMTVTPTNTADVTCNDNGPKSNMYATMENINGGWIMTRGAEYAVTTFPPLLKVIELTSPTNGSSLPEPTITPATPEFKWDAPTLAAGDPAVTTYLVVLIDNKSPYQQTGWAALVKPPMLFSPSVKFSSTPGEYGDVVVLDFGGNGNNPLGFSKRIQEIAAGGDYSWAVLGFHTKTLEDFKLLNFDPSQYLLASSQPNNFTVGGIWKDLTIKVSNGSTIYNYSDSSQGYSVDGAATVDLTVTTPDLTQPTCYLSIDGYTHQNLNAPFTNGVASFTGVALSNKRNQVRINDTTSGMTAGGPSTSGSTGLSKEFQIYTTGGTMPVITYTVTGKTCASVAATLTAPDLWDNYMSTDVCTVDVVATITSGYANFNGLNLNVWNNDGNGQYSAYVSGPLATNQVTFSNVPVFQGRNWIGLYGWDNVSYLSYNNGFSVETTAGSTYVVPIVITGVSGPSNGAYAPTSSPSMYEAYYNVGSDGTATITGTMVNVTTSCSPGPQNCSGYNQSADPNWSWVGNGPITTNSFSIPVTLYTGWNYISLQDASSNWYTVYIYTSGGSKFTLPNVIMTVDGNDVSGSSQINYDTTVCSVDVVGKIDMAKMPNVTEVSVYLNSYNPTTSASVWEYQYSAVAPDGTYTFTQNVYPGSNNIDVYAWDSASNMSAWAGMQVTSSAGSSCLPTVFDVTSMTNNLGSGLTTDSYGDYNAGATATSVTIAGTAKAGNTVSVYSSGMYYTTTSVVAAIDNTFTINIPVYGGYNYISLTDGNNWVYRNVYTNGPGAVWTPPMHNVTVTGNGTFMNITSGGGTSDSWTYFNSDAGTVSISGATTGVDGTGSYSTYGAASSGGPMTITGGQFSISGVQLNYGYNEIDMWDANGNFYYVSIYTIGGVGAPTKYISVTSPTHGAPASGAVGVTATVDPSFAATRIYAYVYDYVNYTSVSYSSDPVDALYGYQPISLVGSDISFNVNVVDGNQTLIEVYGYDVNGYGHGQDIYVNNTWGYSPYFWKPGAKMTKANAAAMAHRSAFQKRMKK